MYNLALAWETYQIKGNLMLDFRLIHDKETGEKWIETSHFGKSLLTISQLNKGTAFTDEERLDFDLIGKLPVRVESLEEQAKRAYLQYQNYPTDIHKNIYLNNLLNKNQVLFYKLVQDHIEEMVPVIYTPIVGSAVQQFSRDFRQERGMYISYQNADHIDKLLDNRSNPDIDLIVVTDGEGVLGIGDQGVGAMDIPIAKLMVYTLCAGIDPNRTLPIMLDVGTNNQSLLDDPQYLGWHNKRVEGAEYDAFINKFVSTVKAKFPNALLHWEDFGARNAFANLENYRETICSFNDDIQGTGVITLSALIAAAKLQGSKLEDQRIVVFGAGSAGVGIADQIKSAMIADGIDPEKARKCFWLIDREGLITEKRYKRENQLHFARSSEHTKAWDTATDSSASLDEVIQHVKPTILLGCSTVSGAFTKEMIEHMAEHVNNPIILPLSNPTSKAEALPQDLIEWTKGKAMIATGSPFDPVSYKGKTFRIAQCNNAFAFPGIGLGALMVQATQITDAMLYKASEAIADYAPALMSHDIQKGLLPSLEQAQETARKVAIAVAKQAISEGVAQINKEANLEDLINNNMWEPEYIPYRRRYT